MVPLLAVTLIAVLLYGVCMILILTGLLFINGSGQGLTESAEEVTVVVPFRNEKQHLPLLVGDLAKQLCTAERFKVILVNDHSSDGSGDLAASLAGGNPLFSCLDLPEGMTGKKAAIQYAVSAAKTKWILQTDADCRIGPNFITNHMSFLSANPSDLVAGLVTTGSGNNYFLGAFERLDALSLTGVGAGSYKLGRPLMCSGANLLYSRDLYLETRPLDPVRETASGDDMFLLIGARKLGRKLSFNANKSALVETVGAMDLVSLVRQRIRWGAKSVHYHMADIQFLATVVAVTSLLLLVSPIWMAVWPETRIWLLSAIGLKTMIDFLVLWKTTDLTGRRSVLWWFLPSALLHYPYLVAAMAGSLIGRYTWKGRVR